MIESARSTDWTPLSRASTSWSALDFGSMALRRITSLFIATCIRQLDKAPADNFPSPRSLGERVRVRGCFSKHGERRTRGESPSPGLLRNPTSPRKRGEVSKPDSEQARAARPLVLGAEHLDRQLGRIGIGRDAVLVEIFGGLLDLDVAGERGDDR